MRSKELRRTERAIRRFIDTYVLDLPSENDPLADGLIDSLGVEMLVFFIEDRFGVWLESEDINWDNFADVPTLAALVVASPRAGAEPLG